MAAEAEDQFDGFVALGCVIRGETSHYDHICESTADWLQQLAVEGGLPIGYGILTCENEQQALVRATPSGNGRDKGGEAVRACLAMVAIKRRFAGPQV
jgi:6,7-dimethyl-8-ribityllumazine synthase